MENDGLVERAVVKAEAPQHVEYRLTALGRTLEQPLAAVCAWATEQRRGPGLVVTAASESDPRPLDTSA
jgi:DNA-binding HxlR family transcriptional regulator